MPKRKFIPQGTFVEPDLEHVRDVESTDDELKDLSGEHSSGSEWTDEDVGKFKNRKAPLVVDLDD